MNSGKTVLRSIHQHFIQKRLWSVDV